MRFTLSPGRYSLLSIHFQDTHFHHGGAEATEFHRVFPVFSVLLRVSCVASPSLAILLLAPAPPPVGDRPIVEQLIRVHLLTRRQERNNLRYPYLPLQQPGIRRNGESRESLSCFSCPFARFVIQPPSTSHSPQPHRPVPRPRGQRRTAGGRSPQTPSLSMSSVRHLSTAPHRGRPDREGCETLRKPRNPFHAFRALSRVS